MVPSFSNLMVVPDGPHMITVQAEDVAGMLGNVTINITIDTVPPTFMIISPEEGFLTNRALTVVEGRAPRTEFMKIEAETKGQRLVGINEVLIHNAQVTSAVRYLVWIDDEALTHEIVGDGLVVATPFGSTGYYRSITHSTFQVGLGLAFNNSTEPLDHLVLRPSPRCL